MKSLRDFPRKAQTTVEFALILWPFMLLLFATIDYAQTYFYQSSLQYALAEAGRFATPGNVLITNFYNTYGVITGTGGPLQSSYSPPNPISRNESIRCWFLSNTVVALQQSSIAIDSWPGGPNGTYTQASPAKGPGYASDNVQITVSYPIKMITPVALLLFPNGVYNATETSIFLNEPSKAFTVNTNMYSGEP